jgi:hypothetical protein
MDSNPKTVFGIAKPSLAAVPPVAAFYLGQALADGAAKYGRFNWRAKPVTASIYYDAALRHVMAWHDGEDCAADSGVHHLAHAMANFAILLDAMETGTLIDDRGGLPGRAAVFIAQSVRNVASQKRTQPVKLTTEKGVLAWGFQCLGALSKRSVARLVPLARPAPRPGST